MAKVLRGSERKEHGPPQATAGKSREGNGGTNRSGPSAASHAAVECPHRRQSASAGLNNPTSTCDSTNLTNILRSCCQSAAFHHSAAASRPCTLYPVLAAAGLVIAAGSALPEHHKRKADDIADHLAPSAVPPTKKQTPDTHFDLPATPVTTTASPKMDSDDDFNSSQASGEDFMDDQDSDLGLEDGKTP